MKAAPPGPELSDWREGVSGLVAAGFDYLDLLTAVDMPSDDVIEVVIHLVRPEDSADTFAHVRLGRADPVIESVADLLPAAAWHEREIHEMFGIEVVGHPDLKPLLLSGTTSRPPLRKDTPLIARIETPWPGAVDEPGRTRRGSTPPGVLPEWLEEKA